MVKDFFINLVKVNRASLYGDSSKHPFKNCSTSNIDSVIIYSPSCCSNLYAVEFFLKMLLFCHLQYYSWSTFIIRSTYVQSWMQVNYSQTIPLIDVCMFDFWSELKFRNLSNQRNKLNSDIKLIRFHSKSLVWKQLFLWSIVVCLLCECVCVCKGEIEGICVLICCSEVSIQHLNI